MSKARQVAEKYVKAVGWSSGEYEGQVRRLAKIILEYYPEDCEDDEIIVDVHIDGTTMP